MTDIEGILTIFGHSDNLLNNNEHYRAIYNYEIQRERERGGGGGRGTAFVRENETLITLAYFELRVKS